MNIVEQKNEVQVLTGRVEYEKAAEKSPKLRKTLRYLVRFATTMSTKLIDSDWNAVCYISQQSIFHFLTWMLSGKVSSAVASHICKMLKTQKKWCSRTLNLWLVVTSCIHKHKLILLIFMLRTQFWALAHCGHTKFKTKMQLFISHFRLNENIRSTTIAAVYFQW